MTPPGPYRLSRHQFRLQVAMVYAPAFVILSVLVFFDGPPSRPRDLLPLLIGSIGPALAVMFTAPSDNAVHLTVLGVRFRKGIRHHTVRWTDVTRLDTRSRLGIRQLVVHTATGERRALPAPLSLAHPEFEREAREIMEWWQVHRLTDT